ncbi:MAG TPA: hypothetical protein VH370_20695 [Humisphaera sp.]|jgi:hypothetical protein|nr:hypothetical protein [Humisphaera sp.]
MMLVALAAVAFAMGRDSSLPGWVFTVFGAVAAALFLLASFNDRNVRANTDLHDILLPWSARVAGGAFTASLIARAGRSTRQ